MMKLKKQLLWLTLSVITPLSAFAEVAAINAAKTSAEKGLAIAQESDRRDNGWVDSQAKMTMVLRNKQGKESSREIRIKNKEVANDGDKSMSIFDTPKDVRGTAMLTYSHVTDADEQWMFLPAVKRVKRISSKNKSGPFMGSEFAFEDLSSFEVEKYSFNYLRDETINGLDCYVLELKPNYKHSGYTRQISWMDKNEYRVQKIEYYDRKNSLLKTQTFSDYNQYLDKYWRAHKISMENHQTGKSTTLSWTDYKFANGFTDADFKKNSLKRVR